MTAQVHEKLILEGGKVTSMAFCPPLPDDASRVILRGPDEPVDSFIVGSTACWRRYIGTWELKDGRLYLNELEGRFKVVGDEPLFADWVTAVLRIPEGDQLHYVHMGFGSIYEFERHIKIENGLVVEERVIDNRKRNFKGRNLGWENLPGNENDFDGDDL